MGEAETKVEEVRGTVVEAAPRGNVVQLVRSPREAQALALATLTFDAEQLAIIKASLSQNLSDSEFAYFIEVAKRTRLDPFRKQIYAIKRWDKSIGDKGAYKVTIQTAIDGFRAIASRTGQLDGHKGPFWCGEDGKWVDAWLSNHAPFAARIEVFRKGCTHSFTGIARFGAYAQDTHFWRNAADNQLAKCAEALALRKAFPEDLAGLYTTDEMEQADATEPPVGPMPTVTPRAPSPPAQAQAQAPIHVPEAKAPEAPPETPASEVWKPLLAACKTVNAVKRVWFEVADEAGVTDADKRWLVFACREREEQIRGVAPTRDERTAGRTSALGERLAARAAEGAPPPAASPPPSPVVGEAKLHPGALFGG